LVVLLALIFVSPDSKVLASSTRVFSPFASSASNYLTSTQKSLRSVIPQGAPALSTVPHVVSNTPCNPCGSGDLRYHNGIVQTHPKVYLIFWGSAWKDTSGNLVKAGQIV